MTSNEEKKKKMRELIHRKKKKKAEGDVKIKGVDKPSKRQSYIQKLKREKADRKTHEQKKPTMVGPHGGVYAETAGGKKAYDGKKKPPTGVDKKSSIKQRLANEKQKHVKKSIEEFVEEQTVIKAFIEKHLEETENGNK